MEYLQRVKGKIGSYLAFFQKRRVWNDADMVYKKIAELRELKIKHRAFPNYENGLRKSYSAFIKKGDVIIDIGAHTGMHLGIFLGLVGETGSVIGFEPLPKQFACLKKTFSVNKNVRLINKALSNETGTFDFFEVDGSPEESSLIIRDRYNDPSNARPHRIQVLVDKLDNYLDEFPKVDYIKIDAEGSEMNILAESTRLLRKCRPIISVEYGFQTYHSFGSTNLSLFKFARKHDYLLSDLWGNIISDIKVWTDSCDSVYWDFFLVPREKVSSFKDRINNNRENMELQFSSERQPVFPFVPKNREVCDKRREFLKDFSISPDYHLAILAYIDEHFGLKGKRILELGGSNIPREIFIDDFAVKQYVGVDYIESWWPDPNHKRETVSPLADLQKIYASDKPYLIFSGSVDDLPDSFLADRFDIAISFSSIEHFSNIPLMLKKAFNVLKKGGLYFASSEPLWSSGKGHHFWISADYNFQVNNDFDFSHLLYDKESFIKNFRSKKDIEKIAQQIYDWSGINRMFYKEIEEAVYSSDFSVKDIYPFILHDPPTDVLKIIRNKHSGRIKNDRDFSIRGIQWILEK